MINIARQLHRLVPVDDGDFFDYVPVVGDQKTVEGAVQAQFSVRNAYSKTRTLERLFFQFADCIMKTNFCP